MGRAVPLSCTSRTTLVALGLVVCFWQVSAATVSCPEGWILGGVTCHKHFNFLASWDRAKETCESYGSTLSVDSKAPVNVEEIRAFSNGTQFWMGLNRRDGLLSDKVRYGEDGPIVDVDSVSVRWGPGEPSMDLQLECAFVDGNVLMSYFGHCDSRKTVSCQMAACPTGSFYCANGGCVTETSVCNGVNDCGDLSDETIGCDCSTKVMGSEGTIQSENYPNLYPESKTCYTLIETPINTIAKLTLDRVNTEMGVDLIQVFIGRQTESSAELYKTFSGSGMAFSPIFSVNNFILVKFSSDGYSGPSASGGFIASYSAVTPPPSAVETRLTATSSWQSFNSPLLPLNPTDVSELREVPGFQGIWIISTPVESLRENAVVTLRIDSINFSKDSQSRVTFIDCEVLTAPELVTLTGKENEPTFVISTGRHILVKYESDGSKHGQGFAISYKSGCEGTVMGNFGRVSSPGFSAGRNYSNLVTCTYNLQTPGMTPFHVFFTNLSLANATEDVLMIQDGTDAGMQLMTLPSMPISILSGMATLTLSASPIQNDQGFAAMFSIDCPNFETTTDTMVSEPGPYRYGSMVSFTCPAGYELDCDYDDMGAGPIMMECKEGGMWSQARIPRCFPKICDLPPEVANGYLASSTGVTFGSNATYSCYDAYNLSPSPVIYCQDSGEWGTAPVCSSQACPNLSVPQFGMLERVSISEEDNATSSGDRFGTVQRLSCMRGYYVEGVQSVVCQSDTTWNRELGSCQPIPCPYVPVANGFLRPSGSPVPSDTEGMYQDLFYLEAYYTNLSRFDNMTSFPSSTYGESVAVTCRLGYEIEAGGASSLICNENGTYGDSITSCVDINECNSAASLAARSCINTMGSFYYTCDAGYMLNEATDRCEDINECDDAPCEQNCTNLQGSYSCDCKQDGYVLYTTSGQEGWQIPTGDTGNDKGDWPRIDHSCVLRQCDLPTSQDIANSLNDAKVLTTYENTVFHVGDTFKVQCSLGYRTRTGQSIPQSKSFTATCLPNGNWDKTILPLLTCEQESCTYDSVTVKAYDPPKSRSCDSGYSIGYYCLLSPLTGSYRMYPQVQCPVVDCGAPDLSKIAGADTNAANGLSAYPVGASFTFSCLSDYEIGPPGVVPTVVCLSEGRWDYKSVYCTGPTCPDPGHVPDAQRFINADLNPVVDISSFAEGATLYYKCLSTGFSISPNGRETITCAKSSGTMAFRSIEGVSCKDTQAPTIVTMNDCGTTKSVRRYDTVSVNAPVFNDNNYFRVVQSPALFNLGGGEIVSESMAVTFTALDGTGGTDGNSVTCSVQINVVGTDEVLPTVTCGGPLYISIDNSTDTQTLSESDFQLVVTSTNTIEFSPRTLTKGHSDIGSSASILVTATNSFGSSALCRIVVQTRETPCAEFYAPSPANVESRVCQVTAGFQECAYTCKAGNYFYVFDFMGAPAVSSTATRTCNTAISWKPLTDCREAPRADLGSGADFAVNVGGATLASPPAPLCQAAIISAYVSLLGAIDASNECGSLSDNVITNKLFINMVSSAINLPSSTLSEDGDGNLQMAFTVDFEFSYPIPTDRATACYDRLATFYNSALAAAPLANVGGCPPVITASIATVGQTKKSLCSAGGSNRFTDGSGYISCLACGQGTFYDSTDNSCKECTKGTYETGYGAVGACRLICTGSKSTRYTGSIAASDCIDSCPAGQTSSDGLVPCRECPPGQYSASSVACQTCPIGTVGKISGAISQSQGCQGPCPAGSYSTDGFVLNELQSCPLCPLHFYQPSDGSQMCMECASSNYTQNVGSVSASDCKDGQTNFCSDRGSCGAAHSGNCVYEKHRVTCPNCETGFTGETCQTEINGCATNPCQFASACETMSQGTFRCNCITGTGGATCAEVDNGCTSLNCSNGGECLNNIGTAGKCLCASGYGGDTCLEESSPCDSSPCVNSGECMSSNRYHYWCVCSGGYTGRNCAEEIDECQSNPCLHDGNCTDRLNGTTCSCQPGFSGDQCQTRDTACSVTAPLPCPTEPAGRYECYEDYIERELLCLSDLYVEPVTVATASETYDYCARENIACHNGTCSTAIGLAGSAHFKCNCMTGYDGSLCQRNIDNCVGNNCEAGSTCRDLVGGFECVCPPGAGGPTCTDITDCPALSACSDQGVCTDFVGGYSCACENGYDGKDCEFDTDECLSSPCTNGGTCTDTVEGFTCKCPPGLAGLTCGEALDQCSSDTCEESGTCISLFAEAVCACAKPAYGARCENEPDVCANSNPCLNSAACSVPTNETEPMCACSADFEGNFCEDCIDLCDGNPCGDNGECKKMFPNSFMCECEEGYSGDKCQTKLDGCASNPCLSSQTCVGRPLTAEFNCICSDPNKVGGDCSRNVDSNFDMYFDNSGKGRAQLRIPFPLGEGGNISTIAFWVRIDNVYTDDFSFLSFESSEHAISVEDPKPLVTFSTSGVMLTPSDSAAQTISYPSDGGLVAGKWYFLSLSLGESEALLWQASLRRKEPLTAAPLNGVKFGFLRLGSSSFNGYISQVNVWSSALDETAVGSQVTENQVNAGSGGRVYISRPEDIILRWSGPSFELNSAVSVTRPSTYCTESSPEPCVTPSLEELSAPATPKFDTCPSDFEVATSDRIASVTWDEPTCTDCVITPSLVRPGNLEVGHHRVVYEGRFGSKSAICSFTISVQFACTGLVLGERCIEASARGEVNQGEAQILCALGFSGKLFEPASVSENDKVRNYLTDLNEDTMQYFIGLTDKEAEGRNAYVSNDMVITSFDGSTEAGDGSLPADMNNSTRNCVVMDKKSNFLWRHVPCGDSSGYICEKTAANLQTCPALSFDAASLDVVCEDNTDFGTQCKVSCKDAMLTLPVILPAVITCNPAEGWSYRASDGNTPRLPNCIKGEAATTSVTLHMEFTVELPCAGVLDRKGADIRAHIIELSETWGKGGDAQTLCNDVLCSEIQLCLADDASCMASPRHILLTCAAQDAGKRKRRATVSSTIFLDILLTGVPAQLYNDVETLTPQEIFLRDIIQLQAFIAAVQLTTAVSNPNPLLNLAVNSAPFCAAGQALVANVLCVPCSPGTFENGAGACAFCPVGEYQDMTGWTNCTACAVGMTTMAAGSASASDCIAACPEGSFYDTAGDACALCPRGFYQDVAGQITCKPCQQGTITNAEGATNSALCIDVCPNGEEYVGGQCTLCPAGQYKTASVHVSCQPCPSMFTTGIQPAVTLVDCNIRLCSVGYFNADNDTTCEPCPLNTYRTASTHQTMCESCGASEVTTSTGSTSETACVFTCSDGEGSENAAGPCQPCPANTYRNNNESGMGNLMCMDCPENYNTTMEGSMYSTNCSVLSCPAGAQPNAGMSGCDACPVGTYNSGPLGVGETCSSCGLNMWTMGEGKTMESECEVHCSDGEELIGGLCTPCNETTYRSNAVDGYFLLCSSCPTGRSTRQSNSTMAADCKFELCNPGSQLVGFTCSECLMGTYQDQEDQTSCIGCPTDQTTNGTGASSINDCLLDCPIGQEDVADSCQDCGVGYYKATTGSGIQCTKCSGYTTTSTGSMNMAACTIKLCDAGERRVMATESCEDCAAGEYQTEMDYTNTTCDSCPMRGLENQTTAVGAKSAAECYVNCAPGTAFTVNKCDICGIGSYSPGGGASSCTSCPDPNFTTMGTGAAAETDCEKPVCVAGQEYAAGSNTCTACMKSFYKETGGDGPCVACATGFNTAASGSTNAADCTVSCVSGSQPNAANDGCDLCPLNFHRDANLYSECQPCRNGGITLSTGATAESFCREKCAPGTHRDPNSNGCVPCPYGTYQSVEGNTATSCQSCPTFASGLANSTTTIQGATMKSECSALNCPEGKEYQPSTPASPVHTCESVPRGYYRAASSTITSSAQLYKMPCPGSFTTSAVGATSVDACNIPIVGVCKDGEFPFRSSVATAYSCEKCLLNTYLQQHLDPLLTKLTCDQCPSDRPITASVGATSIADCKSNEVCVNPALNDCPIQSTCVANAAIQPPYNCQCNSGYRHPVDDRFQCLPECHITGYTHCRNGGVCTQTTAGADCSCLSGFSGDVCQINDALASGTSSSLAIGLGIGGAFFFILLVIGVVTCCICMNKRDPKPKTLSQGESFSNFGAPMAVSPQYYEGYYMNPVQAPYGSQPIAHFESPESAYVSRQPSASQATGAYVYATGEDPAMRETAVVRSLGGSHRGQGQGVSNGAGPSSAGGPGIGLSSETETQARTANFDTNL